MPQVVLLLVCLAIGYLLRRSGALGDGGGKALSAWVINVALPAAAVVHIRPMAIRADWILAAATPWIGALLAWAVFSVIGRKWSRETRGAFILAAGWGNTSFVGIPMVSAYFGAQWTSLVLVIDIFGSYLALSTLGILIASTHGDEKATWRDVFKRVVTFPPFVGLLVALAIGFFPRPAWIDAVFQPIAATLTPIAMAAVGAALRFGTIPGHWREIFLGLGYRLLLAPLLLGLLYAACGLWRDADARIAIFEMAMPPMLGASIIAIRFGLRPDLVAGIIGVGIPLSMLTLPLWAWVLR